MELLPWLSGLLAFFSAFLIFMGLYPKRFIEEAASMKGEKDSMLSLMQDLLIKKISVIVKKYMSEKFELKIRKQLIMAGEPEGLKPEDILAMMVLSGIAGVLFFLLIFAMLKVNLTISVIGLIAFFIPRIWLNDQVTKRHLAITRALPYAIDLLTLSVEAGLDFTAAVSMVVEKGQPGPLREEFSILLSEMKMGKTRSTALRNLMERVDLLPLSSFVRSLIQADKMGTSLGKILRIQSTQMRIERTQRAEKLANEAPVKMLGPLIMCIFPTIFMILFGPIIYKFIS